MLRGELSNRYSPCCLVDYRILLRERYRFFRRNELEIHPMAVAWIKRNWAKSLTIFSVGRTGTQDIEEKLNLYIKEFVHFDRCEDLRLWVRVVDQVYKVLTDDVDLLGLDPVYQSFQGWLEEV